MKLETVFTEFATKDLPPLQKAILSLTGLQNIVTDKRLNIVLNPTFSYHYFIDHVTKSGDVVTTKDTTGACASWGDQSKEAEHNAYLLAKELKQAFKNYGAFLIGHKYYICIDNVNYRIVGMTDRNC